MYLIQDSIEKKFAGLLTDGRADSTTPISSFLSSTGAPPVHHTSHYGSTSSSSSGSSAATMPKPPAAAPRAPASVTPTPAAPGAVRPASVKAAAAASPPTRPASARTTASASAAPAPVASTTAAAPAAPAAGSGGGGTKQTITTTVVKGDLGIGLDLGKNPDGSVSVVRFKDFPAGGPPNPATQCNPPIKLGDVIVGVNAVRCKLFADVVKNIRGLSNGNVTLVLERG